MLKKPCKTNESVNWQSSPRGVISVLKNYELDFHLLSFILKGFWEELSHYLYMTPQPALHQPTPTNQSSFLTLPISFLLFFLIHKVLSQTPCMHSYSPLKSSSCFLLLPSIHSTMFNHAVFIIPPNHQLSTSLYFIYITYK